MMKFYLVKGKPVLFSSQLRLAFCNIEGNIEVLSSMSAFAELSTEEVALLKPIMSEKDFAIEEFWDIETVKKCGDVLLETMAKLEDDDSDDDDLFSESTAEWRRKSKKMSTQLELSLDEPPVNEKPRACDNQLKLSAKILEVKGSVLERLQQVCGDKVKVNLEVYFTEMTRIRQSAGLVTEAMKIQKVKGIRGHYRLITPVCEEKDILVTPVMQKHWETTVSERTEVMKANCNIIISVDDDLEIFLSILSSHHNTNRKILDDAVLSDFEIEASNGAVFLCHKCFLIVNSPVLSTMLQAGLSESKTNRLELEDVSEAGVRALLAFLYYDDETEPKKNLSVAYELLQAGHKYAISRLEQTMLKIFCNARGICIPSDLAMSLFLFLKNIAKGEALAKKLIEIIQIDGPIDNPEYKKILKDHPDICQELPCNGI